MVTSCVRSTSRAGASALASLRASGARSRHSSGRFSASCPPRRTSRCSRCVKTTATSRRSSTSISSPTSSPSTGQGSWMPAVRPRASTIRTNTLAPANKEGKEKKSQTACDAVLRLPSWYVCVMLREGGMRKKTLSLSCRLKTQDRLVAFCERSHHAQLTLFAVCFLPNKPFRQPVDKSINIQRTCGRVNGDGKKRATQYDAHSCFLARRVGCSRCF
mmetsp:Transcript_6424/g.13692  ORF Transcript_6424/g.13692 Transcript_6424/m.13692 type:complete len:217 (-) Transcript_6424:43-693(-)